MRKLTDLCRKAVSRGGRTCTWQYESLVSGWTPRHTVPPNSCLFSLTKGQTVVAIELSVFPLRLQRILQPLFNQLPN